MQLWGLQVGYCSMDTAGHRCRPEGKGRSKVLQENWMDLPNILLFNEVMKFYKLFLRFLQFLWCVN